MEVFGQISIGELLDKISILNIKEKKIKDKNVLSNVIFEKKELLKTLSSLKIENTTVEKYLDDLYSINLQLWEIEDKLRAFEKDNNFDSEFIESARSVYKLNDKRYKIKRLVNEEFGSKIKEEKSYEKY